MNIPIAKARKTNVEELTLQKSQTVSMGSRPMRSRCCASSKTLMTTTKSISRGTTAWTKQSVGARCLPRWRTPSRQIVGTALNRATRATVC